jgi:hypothetical protein
MTSLCSGLCRSWIKSAVSAVSPTLPVYLEQRTSSGQPRWSGSCQRATFRATGYRVVRNSDKMPALADFLASARKRRSPSCRDQQSRLCWHWPRPGLTRKIPGLDNRTRRRAPARMEHGRSCLMGECQAMAPGRERSPAIIIPTPAPSSCHRKQASLRASDESAHPLLNNSPAPYPLWPLRVPSDVCREGQV